MTDIPQDVMERVNGMVGDYLNLDDPRHAQLERIIARAIMAAKAEERERIAVYIANLPDNTPSFNLSADIRNGRFAIRKGEHHDPVA